MEIEVGKLYVNGRGDLIGPMDERAPGIFLDQFGRLYRPDGMQWDHAPGSTGNCKMEIDAQNKHLIGARGGNILMIIPPRPGEEMSKADALVLAAWLVALAEDNEGEFQSVLESVQGNKPANE